jgi:chemotaxis protein MotB
MSTMSLILFVLVLLAYVHNLTNTKRLAAFRHQIQASEQQLRSLHAQIESEQWALVASQAKLRDQQTVIADTGRQLDVVRAQVSSIAVLRVEVLRKLRDAIESELGPKNQTGAELVTIGDGGNILINESLVFEFDSYTVKKEAKPVLDALARALGNVLDDADVRANVDTIVIQGHTDERGDPSHNWDLSAKRASAVLQYLFDANKTLETSYGRYFAASAYSKFRPIDSSQTEQAYAHNRRIEVAVLPRDENIRKVIDAYMEKVDAAAKQPAPP